jgi:phosphatidyl-myo-inositol alpha-mannosyltransferase
MKIGIVSPYDWSYPGGVREHIRHLAEQFINMGHDIRVLAPGMETKGWLAEKHLFYGMGKTAPLPFNGSIARIAIDPMLSWRVRDILQRENFDILHIHEPLVPGLSITALRFSTTLTVGTFHTFTRPGMTSPYHLAYASVSPFLRSYFRRLDGHIAVSTAAYQFASRYFAADYRIIPNGVDLDRFDGRAQPIAEYMDGKQNILFVGRFEKRKGARYLLRAIPLLRERYPNTRFLFVGEGRLRYQFQRYVVRYGLRDVIFTGYVSDADLPRYFASADLFCAPAITGESMGIVLLEAMAAGKPIVASNIPGYATVVNSGTDGLLVPPHDSYELANAIGYLLDNEPLRRYFVETGLRKIHDYAWPYVASKILDYYYALLDEKKLTLHTGSVIYKKRL